MVIFFKAFQRIFSHKRLVGIDVSLPSLTKHHPDIEFKVADIINFNLNYKFDIVSLIRYSNT